MPRTPLAHRPVLETDFGKRQVISPWIMANPFWGWLQHGACQPRIFRSPPGIGYGRSDPRSLTMPVQADRIAAPPQYVTCLPRGHCRILALPCAFVGLN